MKFLMRPNYGIQEQELFLPKNLLGLLADTKFSSSLFPSGTSFYLPLVATMQSLRFLAPLGTSFPHLRRPR